MMIAAVMYEPGSGVATDMLLADVAHTMKQRGLKLAGCIQVNEARGDGCRCRMTLEDLASGRRIGASENRGPLARGCMLDTHALEEVVGLALSSLTPGIDLVIVNRFGKREAEGRGFRPVIETAVELEIPVLIAVNIAQGKAWYEFTRLETPSLMPTIESVTAWCEASSSHHARDLRQMGQAQTSSIGGDGRLVTFP